MNWAVGPVRSCGSNVHYLGLVPQTSLELAVGYKPEKCFTPDHQT